MGEQTNAIRFGASNPKQMVQVQLHAVEATEFVRGKKPTIALGRPDRRVPKDTNPMPGECCNGLAKFDIATRRNRNEES